MPARQYFAIAAIALVLGASIGAAYTIKGVRWRLEVLNSKLSGQIPDIPALQLLLWLRPGSPVYLEGLAQNPNLHAMIENPDRTGVTAAAGRELLARHCGHCHGASGEGGTGPSLVEPVRNGLSDWAFLSAVKWGRPGTAMAAQPITDREAWQVHAFARKAAQDKVGGELKPRGRDIVPVAVPFEAIRDRHQRPEDWLTYAGGYAGHRHTTLASITRENAADLEIEWLAQLRAADAYLEASPIVHKGRIFVSESPDGVVSLDAATGEVLWRYRRPVPSNIPLCCGSPNRGVAILDDAVFVQTLDAHLVAIDAATGEKRWEVKLADYRNGYSMTGAPLALRDKIVVGVAGGVLGIRGFVTAVRAGDGHRLWTFNTVPGPGEKGHETWAGDSWKTGGAATWVPGAYDPETRTVFWGVGNPAPVFSGSSRAGDNLYSGSVVALDEDSGTLRWHYQFTPSDEHDWDATQQPVLAEIPWQGQQRPVVLWANRNGFFYVLDRRTGKFLLAKPYVKQTWASGFAAEGRPILRKEARPSPEGTLAWPGVGGGTNWWPPSYDAARRLLFVPTVDAASIYYRAQAQHRNGALFLGGTSREAREQPTVIALKAIDVTTGAIRWERRLAEGPAALRRVGGILSTASGVVFAGYRDEFLAMDADTGQVLRRIRVGGVVSAAPVSYVAAGRQHVAVMAGRSLFAFAIRERASPTSARAGSSR